MKHLKVDAFSFLVGLSVIFSLSIFVYYNFDCVA